MKRLVLCLVFRQTPIILVVSKINKRINSGHYENNYYIKIRKVAVINISVEKINVNQIIKSNGIQSDILDLYKERTKRI